MSAPRADHIERTGLARRVLQAFEREFWAGHHDRGRLLAAPLRVLHQALHSKTDAAAVIEALLLELEPPARRGE